MAPTDVTPSPRRQQGVTLAEACCTLCILAILATLAIPAMRQWLDARRLEGVARQLASDLRFVRSEALARNEPLRLSLQAAPGGSCYVVHTGSAHQCRCVPNGPAQCQGAARSMRSVQLPFAEGVRLESLVSSALFDPRQGTTSPTATWRVIGARAREIDHIVNIMGRLRSCSPHGSVAGYRPC